MKNQKSRDISCHAVNCVYHCEGDGCKAEKIEVQCPSACDCRETQCSTFKCGDQSNSCT